MPDKHDRGVVHRTAHAAARLLISRRPGYACTVARPLVEICIESPDDARAAAGADRLELCQALAVGGLTPSSGAQKEVRAVTNRPIMTMTRPRPGGFTYTASEFTVMQRDIEAAIELGADGIVFGILTDASTIDVARTTQLVHQIQSCSRTLDIVFHRAFDFVPDPFAALNQLIGAGVTRVLTSGQQATAMEGAPLIRDLVVHASGRIQILPGGGIRPENVAALIAQTRCDQVHASLRRASRTNSSRSISLASAAADVTESSATSAQGVQALLAALRG